MSYLKKILSLVIAVALILLVIPAIAANNKSLYKAAEKFLEVNDYESALANYKTLYESNSENYNITFKIGYCYLHLEKIDDLTLAIKYLDISQPNIDSKYKDKFNETAAPPETEYYLGVAYRLNSQYKKAVEHFKAYKSFKKRNLSTLTDELLQKEIESCEFSMSNPPVEYQVQIYNFDVDIPEGNYLRCPVISGDESMFVYTLGDKNVFPPDVNTDRDMYYMPLDKIYFSNWEGDKWSSPKLISDQLNIRDYAMPVSLSHDGKTLFLVHDDGDDGNIYVSYFDDGNWTPVEKLNKNINSGKWETHAVINKTGNKLYFTSARKGGVGDLDLYVSDLSEEGEWMEPQLISSELNTPFHEETPFVLDNQNQLYFASEGHGNMGGFDMFVSVFDSINNKWGEPQNLGFPYNTVGNDLAYIVSFQNQFIYCPQNSNKRRTGIGISDCFSLRMPYDDKLVSLNATIFIPELNNVIPEDLLIAALDNETGDTIKVVKPNDDGTFTIDSLTAGDVTLVALSSKKIENHIVEVVVPENFSETVFPMDIYLNVEDSELASEEIENKEVEIAIVVKNLLFDFDKYNVKTEYEQNLTSLAKFMAQNENFRIEIEGHTDHFGSESYNSWLGKMRAQAVKSFLIQQGASADNISIVSKGEKEPIAKVLDQEEARKYNRRAVIVLKSDTGKIVVEEIAVPEEFQLN
jgi:outer membrane protein OmpA-like peptidoglycan-associated protein